MRFSWLLFDVVSVFSILVCLANAQDEEYIYHRCSGANYTSNSIYQKNLNTLLYTVSSNKDIDYGFYNISEGEGSDIVRSIALCRGDISLNACRKCVNFSTTDLPRRCPNNKEALALYVNCMFRYSDRPIFRSLDDNVGVYVWNVNNASNENLFTQTLDNLLTSLRKNASSGGSRQKFAIGDTKYVNFQSIYGLVQCTPDLTEVQCNNCLAKSFREFESRFPGKVGGRAFAPSCNFIFGLDQFYDIPPPPSSPPPLPPPPPPPPPTATNVFPPIGGGSNMIKNIIISVVSTVCFVILIVCMYVFLRLRNRRDKLDNEIGAETLQLDFGTIKAATNNFSIDNKLGQGGFGSVYKGKLADGQEIAVKRLATDSGQGDLEFKNEVVLVAKLQHRNLVRLLGFCLQGQERLLIYEFVANASLDQFLVDPAKRSFLDWERRFKIIVG